MNIDLSGLKRLETRFNRIADPDATPLMRNWMQIIDQDNRKGVLAGLDKDGNPMTPVKYRPVGPPKKLRHQSRAFNAGGVNGNLTTAEYRRLGGPPLAPRGQFSRVITNLLTDFQDGRIHKVWMAWGYWKGVISKKGVSFLPFHFDPKVGSRLPKRDLRGVRPEGIEKAQLTLRNWIIDIVRRAA